MKKKLRHEIDCRFRPRARSSPRWLNERNRIGHRAKRRSGFVRLTNCYYDRERIDSISSHSDCSDTSTSTSTNARSITSQDKNATNKRAISWSRLMKTIGFNRNTILMSSSSGEKSECSTDSAYSSIDQLMASFRAELANLELRYDSKAPKRKKSSIFQRLLELHDQLRSLRITFDQTVDEDDVEGDDDVYDAAHIDHDADAENSDTCVPTDVEADASCSDSEQESNTRTSPHPRLVLLDATNSNVSQNVHKENPDSLLKSAPPARHNLQNSTPRRRMVSYRDQEPRSSSQSSGSVKESPVQQRKVGAITSFQPQYSGNKQPQRKTTKERSPYLVGKSTPSRIDEADVVCRRQSKTDSFNQDQMSTESSNAASAAKLPKVVHQHTLTSLEYLQDVHGVSFNRIRTISVNNLTGDMLYIDDSGRNIKRLRLTCECHALMTGNQSESRDFSRSLSADPDSGSSRLDISVLHGSDKKIGGACWLHTADGNLIAFVQGRDTVKIFDTATQKLKQRIHIKGAKVSSRKDTEMYHSNIYERSNGHLIVGLSGGTTLYDFAYSIEKGQYVMYRSVPITIEMLCFTYNPVLELVGFIFHNSPACPLLLDWNYDEYAYLRLQRGISTRPPQPSQILILDSGFVLVNDWSPPCQIHVFNLEGNRVGAVKMHQLMISAWAVRRPVGDASLGSALKRTASKSGDEDDADGDSIKSAKKRNERNERNVKSPGKTSHIISIDMITHQLDRIVKNTQNNRSMIYLYDMTLHCLSEILLDR